MLIRVRRKFSSAHKLPDYKGECANLHGHTWTAAFLMEGAQKANGMVDDFKELKDVLDGVLPDHKYLNDLVPNPTAENLALYIFGRAAAVLKERGLKLKEVELWENENASAVVQG